MTPKLFTFHEWNARHAIPKMVHLWMETLGEDFPLSKDLFERNVFHPLYLNVDRSSLLIDKDKIVGYLIAKTDNFERLGSNNCLWISCVVVDPNYQRKGYGSKMIRHALDQGAYAYSDYHVGSDPHHFFPGIPSQLTGAQNFFQKLGFSLSGKAYDLQCYISKHRYTAPPVDGDFSVRRLLPSDQGDLFKHMKKNYSVRWLEDTKWCLTFEKAISSIIGLFHKERLVGFTHVHSVGDPFWIPSVYWRKKGNPSIGGLGPVGIHKDYRGSGLGSYFMVESLKILQEEGVQEMEIDWTGLLDFYKKFHFEPHRSYVHGQLQVREN